MGEEALDSSREVIFVAVGTNFLKERINLLWVKKVFPVSRVVLIHVHVLSKGIPMMGAKILPSIASESAIMKYRMEEREKMLELMNQFMNFCERKKMQVIKTVVIQDQKVLLGLQRLVEKLQIKRLVNGSRFISRRKEFLSCCEVWLVCKGKHISTRGVAFVCHNTNSQGEEIQQYWEALPYLYDSDDCLQFMTPPSYLENEIVDNVEETQSIQPRRSRSSTGDAMNAELLRQQLDSRDLAELKSKSKRVHEEACRAFENMVKLEQQIEVLIQDKSKALIENLTLKAHLQLTEYSTSELVKATNNFNPSQKIGEGGYGTVYEGILRYAHVAIKVLNPESSQGPSEFQQEALMLSKIRHPNIVMLHGICPEISALVYEFLPNGNLDDKLIQSNNKTPKLSCRDRFRIISEQRSVLLFLHSCQPQAVVHADLKLHNILLDANNISKLGDFGAARLIPRSGAEDDTIFRRTNNMGTIGYIDPMFMMDGWLTPESDVYSFGIVIMRLLTGLPVMGIRERVERGLEGGIVHEMLDSSAGKWPLEETEKLMELALKCSSFERSCRPSLLSEEWRVLETLMGMRGVR